MNEQTVRHYQRRAVRWEVAGAVSLLCVAGIGVFMLFTPLTMRQVLWLCSGCGGFFCGALIAEREARRNHSLASQAHRLWLQYNYGKLLS